MDYLVFRLYGPMASWGEIAVGESRHSASYPSKSAVVGLLGAALGIDRQEDERHQSLAEGYWQAAMVLSTGHMLKDYHTAQVPDSVGKFQYRTRRDEIIHGRDRLGTVLSSREYRTDALAVVAIQALEKAPFALTKLQLALKAPQFHLYLGRKSCPTAAPLNPQIIEASCFREALGQYIPGDLLIEPRYEWLSDKRWLPRGALTQYCWEGTLDAFSDTDDVFSPQQVQKLVRHDMPLSRRRWQFQPRSEYLWLSKEAG